MRLMLIASVNFQKSEYTNLLHALKRLKKVKLKDDDVVCFISQSAKQIVFVWRPNSVMNGKQREVIRSQRLRLPNGGTWTPTMLAEYAEQIGLKLNGIKRFAEHYTNLNTQSGR